MRQAGREVRTRKGQDHRRRLHGGRWRPGRAQRSCARDRPYGPGDDGSQPFDPCRPAANAVPPDRDQQRPRHRRRHRDQEVRLRPVGRHRQHRIEDGVARHPRRDPSHRGDSATVAERVRARGPRPGRSQRQGANERLHPAGRPIGVNLALTRRRLIGTGAALGASFAFRRLHAAPRGPTVVVIGAGAFGGWTALQLVRRGARVTLVDAWGPGNARASSGDETRVIRSIYGASRLYTRMALDSLIRWKDNERRWGRTIFHETGALWMLAREDSPYETKALPLLREMKVPVEELSVVEAGRRWPQVSFGGVARVIHEPEAGYLEARRGCEAVFESFLKEGGRYRSARAAPGEMAHRGMAGGTLDGLETLEASRYVFACGAWISRILPLPKATIRATRQEVFY